MNTSLETSTGTVLAAPFADLNIADRVEHLNHKVGFVEMLRKRAGWLSALILGDTLL